MVKYDKNGRPIKENISFFDKLFTPKKRTYSKKINSKREKYEDKIKVFDKKIKDKNENTINSDNSIKKEEEIQFKTDFDISKIPIFLIYFIVWFTGFLGIVGGIIYYTHINAKNNSKYDNFLKHLKIALIIYCTVLISFIAFPLF